MARIWQATGLIGNAAGDLDAILSIAAGDYPGLANDDFCVVSNNVEYVDRAQLYRYESANAESENSPFIIIPDDNVSGTGAWVWQTTPMIQWSLTANTTLASQHLSPMITIDNVGASADLAHSLPAGSTGMYLRSINSSASYKIKFTANGTETITMVNPDGSSSTSIAGGYIELAAGDGYQLEMYFNGTKWVGKIYGSALLETS